jgi:MFS family permease
MRTPLPFLLDKINSKFILYFFAIAFIYFADSVMLYYFPLIVESSINSNVVLGIIIGLASVLGLILDIVIPQSFKGRSWKVLFLIGVTLSVFFPIVTNLGVVFSSVYLFIIASAIWGVYYEFLAFGNQKFVVANVDKENYSKFWGSLALTTSFGSIAAPILGSFLYSAGVIETGVVLFFIQLVGLICSFILVFKLPDTSHQKQLKGGIETTIDFIKEFRYWEIIGFRIWPLIILIFTLAVVDSVFSVLGGIFGEHMFKEMGFGWLILFLYYVPDIVVSGFLSRKTIREHKKRIVMYTTLLAGIFLLPIVALENYDFIIISLILLASIMLSFSWILIYAVFSDLQKRAGNNDIHVNSIIRANMSVGYIVGPIVAGFISDMTNYYVTFGLAGLALIIAALIQFIYTPRKLRLPQKLLADVK